MKAYVLAAGISQVKGVLLIKGLDGPIGALVTENHDFWKVFTDSELFYVKVLGLSRDGISKFNFVQIKHLNVYTGRILDWSDDKGDLLL